MKTIVTALAVAFVLGTGGSEALAGGRGKARRASAHHTTKAPAHRNAVRATRPATSHRKATVRTRRATARRAATVRNHRTVSRAHAPARVNRRVTRARSERVRRVQPRQTVAHVRDHRQTVSAGAAHVLDHRKGARQTTVSGGAKYVWKNGRWVLAGSRWTRGDAGVWYGYPTGLPPAAALEARYRGEYYCDDDGTWAWIPGYWEWYYDEWIWVPGYWAMARIGHAWRSGYWESAGDFYRRVPGGWVKRAGGSAEYGYGGGHYDETPAYDRPGQVGARDNERVPARRGPVPGGRY